MEMPDAGAPAAKAPEEPSPRPPAGALEDPGAVAPGPLEVPGLDCPACRKGVTAAGEVPYRVVLRCTLADEDA